MVRSTYQSQVLPAGSPSSLAPLVWMVLSKQRRHLLAVSRVVLDSPSTPTEPVKTDYQQVFKVAAPTTNSETGEICEDLICVTCNPNKNDETGEVEFQEKSKFKVPFGNTKQVKKTKRAIKPLTCEKCQRGRLSLILLIVTLTMVLPSLGVFLYIMAESLLHQYTHKFHNQQSSFRNKLHCLFYSQFCAFCQAERSMDLIGKLQDERLAKMRKYVKNIPIQ